MRTCFSRSASTCSKTIIFHERNKPADENKSSSEVSSKVVNADGISRPAGFFASTHLSVETLFYLATLGGAQVCNLEDRIGNFVVGKEFDALLVQTGQKEPAGVVAGTNGAANDGGATSLLEVELEKALAGGESVLEDGVENPALMLEPDEGIERVFEKFLFTVSGGRPVSSSVLADSSKLTLPSPETGRRSESAGSLCARAPDWRSRDVVEILRPKRHHKAVQRDHDRQA